MQTFDQNLHGQWAGLALVLRNFYFWKQCNNGAKSFQSLLFTKKKLLATPFRRYMTSYSPSWLQTPVEAKLSENLKVWLTNWPTDRQTDWPTDRQTDRWTNRARDERMGLLTGEGARYGTTPGNICGVQNVLIGNLFGLTFYHFFQSSIGFKNKGFLNPTLSMDMTRRSIFVNKTCLNLHIGVYFKSETIPHLGQIFVQDHSSEVFDIYIWWKAKDQALVFLIY